MSAKRAKTLTPEEVIDLCFAKVLEYEKYENTKQQRAQYRRKLREYRNEVMSVIAAATASMNGEDDTSGRDDNPAE